MSYFLVFQHEYGNVMRVVEPCVKFDMELRGMLNLKLV